MERKSGTAVAITKRLPSVAAAEPDRAAREQLSFGAGGKIAPHRDRGRTLAGKIRLSIRDNSMEICAILEKTEKTAAGRRNLCEEEVSTSRSAQSWPKRRMCLMGISSGEGPLAQICWGIKKELKFRRNIGTMFLTSFKLFCGVTRLITT